MATEVEILVERCRGGDELAWESLVRRFQGRIYAIAYHYVGDAEEARDLAQDIFVQIYRQLPTCREADRFLQWLLRIARNACIDRLRRLRARPPRQDVPVEQATDVIVEHRTPDDALKRQMRERLVHQALRSLSDLSREVIVLKDMQGLSLAEIASLLDVPLGTVKSRSNRARLELARAVVRLAPAGVAPHRLESP